ncbi:hypothetical protein BCR34DRAFT_579815 [Clohesyomyces aquaticus]|uniref:RRM domain-containing protein n=1 Tax=Clohesyomyces aquaticus TaxID=1231657 RepID=A0A1Y1Y9M8_9PLEO|nr:hypothetical protein BCR34DRAFT_579815 [Clohesyomyces aquaticus]
MRITRIITAAPAKLRSPRIPRISSGAEQIAAPSPSETLRLVRYPSRHSQEDVTPHSRPRKNFSVQSTSPILSCKIPRMAARSDVETLFSEVGVKVKRISFPSSHAGHCFVALPSEEMIPVAIAKLDGKALLGSIVRVRDHAQSFSDRASIRHGWFSCKSRDIALAKLRAPLKQPQTDVFQAQREQRRLYVGHIPLDISAITYYKIYKLFHAFHVKRVSQIFCPRASIGHVYVDFTSAAEMQRAILDFDASFGRNLFGADLDVKPAAPPIDQIEVSREGDLVWRESRR